MTNPHARSSGRRANDALIADIAANAAFRDATTPLG